MQLMSINVQRLMLVFSVLLIVLSSNVMAQSAQKNNESTPSKPRVVVVYSEKYLINTGGRKGKNPFDILKFKKIHGQLIEDGLMKAEDFRVPKQLTKKQMLLVHTTDYLETLNNPQKVARYLEAPGVAQLPSAMIDAFLLEPFRYSSGGTVLASRLALKYGIAINVGGGYHHAKPTKGEGFCVYADMAIAVKELQKEKLVKRVLIVDLDVHQGNGTVVCFAKDPNVYTFSMHQGSIYPKPKEKGSRDIELTAGTTDNEYMKILRKELPKAIAASKPDLVVLQAGCDTLRGDPLARLSMTHKGIVERDALVVDSCVKEKIPVIMTLGGGYTKDAWKAQHASMSRILKTYGVVPAASQARNSTGTDPMRTTTP